MKKHSAFVSDYLWPKFLPGSKHIDTPGTIYIHQHIVNASNTVEEIKTEGHVEIEGIIKFGFTFKEMEGAFKEAEIAAKELTTAFKTGGLILASTEDARLTRLQKAIPALATLFNCPAAREEVCIESNAGVPLWQVIMHLNDGHNWTRERIADWLDTLEVDLSFSMPEEVSNDNSGGA